MINLVDFDGFIFDYGGVLVGHQTEAERTAMAEMAKMPAEQFEQGYWGERIDYDRGLIDAAAYWTKVAGHAASRLTPLQIGDLTEADSVSWMRFDEPMWKWIQQLRSAGRRAAILSNMPMDLGEALKARTDRLNYFDHVTLSYELKVVKPDPAIYEQCLEGLGTAADRTLFLDDRIENVSGAEMMGIRGLQFSTREEVLVRLTPYPQLVD